MKRRPFDLETVRESFVYLYRCWLEKYWKIVPEKLALTATDGILLAPNIQLYYSTSSVSEGTARELQSQFGSVCMLAPELPNGAVGVNTWCTEGLPENYAEILDFLISRLDWLDGHSERGITKNEAYETAETGSFEIWKARSANRLLLEPKQGELYGYVVITNKPKDFFFRRSRSCSKDGRVVGTGRYKRSNHRFESGKRTNIDLIFDTGDVHMLSMIVAGAGYKVFPRLSPEPTPDCF